MAKLTTPLVAVALMASVATIPSVYAQDNQATESALDILNKRVAEFPEATKVSQLNAQQQEELRQILLTNFEQKAIQLAKEDYVTQITRLDTAGLTKYFTPTVARLRRENPTWTPQQASAEAMKIAIAQANADLYTSATWQALMTDVKGLFEQLLTSNLLRTNNNLTIGQLKADIHELHRGLFFLVQNFKFQSNLPQQLVLNPEQFGQVAPQKSAYERLVAYGTTTPKSANAQTNKSIIDNFVRLSNGTKQYDEKVKPYTGVDIFELIAILAQKQGVSASTYFNQKTQAVIAKSDAAKDAYAVLKEKVPTYVLPILSNGANVYAGVTTNGVTIGLVNTYLADYPTLDNGNALTPILNQQENFWTFMQSTSQSEIKPMVAIDTMFQYDTTTQRYVWGTESTNVAIRDFFASMNIMPAYTPGTGLAIGGYSDHETMFHAVGERLMSPNGSGLTLFSHETTHSKERNLFGVKRLGQGPEFYARGLFEDIDNTQGANAAYKPVFFLNTTIDVGDKTGRTQAKKAHTSKEQLQNYTKNLLDLVAYMEVMEANVTLAMSSEDKAVYFNKVNQVSAQNDTQRRNAGSHLTSTNDEFVGTGVTANTIADLVNQNAVSGQFIPKGVSPLLTVNHNDYANVPMLSSFYAAPQQTDAQKNSVGDVSFQRLAYEVLAWKGWTAFTNYIGNGSTSDTQAFSAILNGEFGNRWSDYKIAKYTELATYEVNATIKGSFATDLEDAVKKDLAVIKAFKEAVAPIVENTALTPAEKQRQIVEKATQTGVYTRATNVANVKAALLERALDFNELESSVLVAPQAPVDLTLLQQEVNMATIIKASIAYINADSSLKNTYDQRLVDARAILTANQPTQEVVNRALQALVNAKGALNGVLADKTPLATEVSKASEVKASIAYINADSALKQAYDTQLVAAQRVLSESNPSAATIVQALQALVNARNALNGVLADKTALQTEVSKENAVISSVFYQHAEIELQEAYIAKLNQAKTVLAESNPSATRLTQALTDLVTAKNALNGALSIIPSDAPETDEKPVIKTTEYVDDKGKVLLGANFNVNVQPVKVIDGYTFIETQTTATGVKHVYIKNISSVPNNAPEADEKPVIKTTEYVDDKGKVLLGANFNVNVQPVKVIDGYIFIETQMTATGVKHVYIKNISSVPNNAPEVDEKPVIKTTEYVDDKGKVLLGANFNVNVQPVKVIDGYTFIETQTTATGVKHVYIKNTSSVPNNALEADEKPVIKTTEYVDDKGNMLLDVVFNTDIHPVKEIDGYVFLETQRTATGIKRIYTKKVVSSVDKQPNSKNNKKESVKRKPLLPATGEVNSVVAIISGIWTLVSSVFVMKRRR